MIKWSGGKEGWLNKQSEGMLGKKWQKRWFVLDGLQFRYSHTQDGDARKVFDLDNILEIGAGAKPTEFQLIVFDCGDDAKLERGKTSNPASPRDDKKSKSRFDRSLSPNRAKSPSKSDGEDEIDKSESPKRRTVLLSAETEYDRISWVDRLQAALSARRATKDGILLVADRLSSNSDPCGTTLSVRSEVAELLKKDASDAYKGINPSRFDLSFNDSDLDFILQPLRTNTTIVALELVGGRGGEGVGLSGGLSHIGLTNSGATAIAEAILENTTLTSLRLSDNSIGDEGAAKLLDSAANNKTLTELDLDRNTEITEEGVHELYSKIASLGNNRFLLRLPEKALEQRALAGNVAVGLKEHEAAWLRQIVWPVDLEDPDTQKMIVEAWGRQGFEFARADDVKGGQGRFQFGFRQHRNGACGVLAAVQAELLRSILFPDASEMADRIIDEVDSMDWDILDKEVFQDVAQQALTRAISKLIWRCRPDNNAAGRVILVDSGLQDPLNWECFKVIECTEIEKLQAIVKANFEHFTGPGAVVLLLYSAVMTRGLQRVWEELGNNPKAGLQGPTDLPTIRQTLIVLEGGCPFCEQSLVNLLLTGQASPDLNPKEQSTIGFLTYTENSKPADEPANWNDGSVVGSSYKTPKCPIWILHGGSHYTVLLARSPNLLKLAEPAQNAKPEEEKIKRHRRVPSGGLEGEYVLEHYNGLPPAGPRLTRLYMFFNLANGGQIDSEELRRRWSYDDSEVAKQPDPVAENQGDDDDEAADGAENRQLLQFSNVWCQFPTRQDGVVPPPASTGAKTVTAANLKELTKAIQEALFISDTVQAIQYRKPEDKSKDWKMVGKDLEGLTTGTELLLLCGKSPQFPVPPALEQIQANGCFHVCNKRTPKDGHSVEFEVALEAQTEALVLWSLFHYDMVEGVVPQKVEEDEPFHKLQLVTGMMPQMVDKATMADASFIDISFVKQNRAEKWRCRHCSLILSQPSLSEEEYFQRLCALNDADSAECKVCKKRVDLCGRALWLDYNKLPAKIRAHIDASDRWRPPEQCTMPPILHVVRTRWAGAQLRPGPLWPSKGGPTL